MTLWKASDEPLSILSLGESYLSKALETVPVAANRNAKTLVVKLTNKPQNCRSYS
jgi:hypothetical protein